MSAGTLLCRLISQVRARGSSEAALDPAIREDLFESAAIYEEVANDLDDRLCGG